MAEPTHGVARIRLYDRASVAAVSANDHHREQIAELGLSAVEGMKLVDHGFEAFVIPITLAIFVGLFAIQCLGTGGPGGVSGQVILVGLMTMAPLGGIQVAADPVAAAALSPSYAVAFLVANLRSPHNRLARRRG